MPTYEVKFKQDSLIQYVSLKTGFSFDANNLIEAIYFFNKYAAKL